MNNEHSHSRINPRLAPHFIIAGCAKTGSTSLADYLAQHPDVFMTEPKEPNYFRTDDGAQCYHDLERRRPVRARRFARTPEWYEGLFTGAGPGQLRGEASIAYLRGGRACAERLEAEVPGVRLIFILRRPGERAYSAYLHLRRDGRERLSFEQGLEMEARRMATPMLDMFYYRSNLPTYDRLSGFYEVFGADRIKVMLHDDWADRARFVREVLEFIGADPDRPLDLSARRNVGALPRHPWMQRRLSPETSQRLQALLPFGIWRRWQGAIHALRRRNLKAPPPADPALLRRLTEECREDILKTQTLIGRDLSHWLDHS